MHILFLTDNFPPEVNAPASRTFEHCREWVKAGHQVTVVTCAPNFPKGKVYDGYRNRLWQREDIEGISVVRVWSYITANEGFLRRTLDYASYMASAMLTAPFLRGVDIVVATSPQFFTACAGYAVSRMKRVPYMFELRDLWPESIRALGAMKNEHILRSLEQLELSLYHHAAAIVPVTNAFAENLAQRGVPIEKMHVVTNGADLSRFSRRRRDEALAERLGLKDKFVVGYIGTHGIAHGLTTILEAAKILSEDPMTANVRFMFLGDGAEKSKLVATTKEMMLENVIFLDSVPRDAVAAYWSLLDVSVIHLKKTPLFETVIPSKLFECMAMGLPVLHGLAGESAQIVEREGVGLVFEPENAGALRDNLCRLVADPALRQRLSDRGPVAVQTYDRKALAARMLTIIEAVCEEQASPRRNGRAVAASGMAEA